MPISYRLNHSLLFVDNFEGCHALALTLQVTGHKHLSLPYYSDIFTQCNPSMKLMIYLKI